MNCCLTNVQSAILSLCFFLVNRIIIIQLYLIHQQRRGPCSQLQKHLHLFLLNTVSPIPILVNEFVLCTISRIAIQQSAGITYYYIIIQQYSTCTDSVIPVQESKASEWIKQLKSCDVRIEMKEKLQHRSEDLPGVVEDEEVNFNKR